MEFTNLLPFPHVQLHTHTEAEIRGLVLEVVLHRTAVFEVVLDARLGKESHVGRQVVGQSQGTVERPLQAVVVDVELATVDTHAGTDVPVGLRTRGSIDVEVTQL